MRMKAARCHRGESELTHAAASDENEGSEGRLTHVGGGGSSTRGSVGACDGYRRSIPESSLNFRIE